MFSLFKKIFSTTKQDEQEHVELEAPDTAPPIPVPEFDYTARVPEGWTLYVDGGDYETVPVTSYGQIRRALEELQELVRDAETAFLIIDNDAIPGGCAQTLCLKPDKRGPQMGEHYYFNELQLCDDGFHLYGEPKEGVWNDAGLKIDDSVLLLCTFIRDGGKLPEFPHMMRTFETDRW